MPTNASLHPNDIDGFRDNSSQDRGVVRSFALPAALTSFIGREREVEAVSALLRRPEVRLVTLTGPGGVGKTRLALEAASIVQSRGDRDVLFIPLASNLDPELVAPAIGQAAGLDATSTQTLPDRLAIALDGHNVLLVLDNFEQLLPAAPLVAAILTSCPTLQVLVTSRTLLHLSAEHEFSVSALEIPQTESPEAPFAETPAEQLFIERAKLRMSDLSSEDFVSIGEICRRLDGLPLAIELAAANTRIMSPSELLTRMDRALPLLTGGPRDAPPRLQTMRNAIAWSYDLLSGEEQALFRTLSVFQGGFTLTAAEAVAPASLTAPVVSLFHALVDSSLVLRSGARSDAARFTMLETVKEFGLESLVFRGEEFAARDRHLMWTIEEVGAPQSPGWPWQLGVAIFAFPREQDNMRLALNWALDNQKPEQAAKIACSLVPFWRRNGLFTEAAATLDRVGSECREVDSVLFAAIANASAQFLYQLGDFPKASGHASEALDICRKIEETEGMRANLRILGMVTTFTDGDAAIELQTEALQISRGLNDSSRYALDLRQRVFTNIVLGHLRTASSDLAEAMPLLRGLPDPKAPVAFGLAMKAWIAAVEQDFVLAASCAHQTMQMALESELVECQSFCHRFLGVAAVARKAFQIALESFQEAFRIVYRSGLLLWEGYCLYELAVLAQTQRDFERSTRLFGAADANWSRLGFSKEARAHATWAGQFQPSQENTTRERFTSEFLVGQQLSRREAYTLAMTMTIAPTTGRNLNSLLSPRELEVLQQLANGYTNREIAETLFISGRTVDFHVTSILSKLDVDSRRAAVTVARERRLLTDRDTSRPRLASIP